MDFKNDVGKKVVYFFFLVVNYRTKFKIKSLYFLRYRWVSIWIYCCRSSTQLCCFRFESLILKIKQFRLHSCKITHSHTKREKGWRLETLVCDRCRTYTNLKLPYDQSIFRTWRKFQLPILSPSICPQLLYLPNFRLWFFSSSYN
jgi:hypothetical protein